ncbi:MucR family transcriptional regulator [Glycocaulis abyssi]|uniref:MucR family transcriptional regulator n=1 Tax=Glycocaulis abyssi TaxID=1433403 RepID=A0ABV9N8B8_9PROT
MTEDNTPPIDQEEVLRMTTDIVASYVANNTISADGVPEIIRQVHGALRELTGVEAKPEAKAKPAVPVSRSVTDDYIICLEDGKKLKMLKRYLRSQYDMSPDDYRRKWGLPSDYPMVAPAYSRRRSDFAKEIGLGRGGRKSRK